MAVWTATPYTAVAGSVLTAANWNAQIKDLQTAFGAWGSYSPALGGFTAGNGSWADAVYMQVSKKAEARAQFNCGTTTVFATASPTISLPVTVRASANSLSTQGYFVIAGQIYQAHVRLASTTSVGGYIIGASGLATTPTTTTPATWSSSSQIFMACAYEAA